MGLDAVQVRIVDLDAAEASGSAEHGTGLLDPAELTRARRFRDPTDRRRYIVAHSALRRLLAAATGLDPRAVHISREPCAACGGPHGRPVTDGVRFSLSRSGRFAAIALADEPCGVDIEGAQDGGALEALRADVLAPGETSGDLLRTWVRKEALLKATGEGLTRAMSSLRVDGRRQEQVRGGFDVRDLDTTDGLPAGLIGAVAVAPSCTHAPPSSGSPSFTDAPPATGKVRAPAHDRSPTESTRP